MDSFGFSLEGIEGLELTSSALGVCPSSELGSLVLLSRFLQ